MLGRVKRIKRDFLSFITGMREMEKMFQGQPIRVLIQFY